MRLKLDAQENLENLHQRGDTRYGGELRPDLLKCVLRRHTSHLGHVVAEWIDPEIEYNHKDNRLIIRHEFILLDGEAYAQLLEFFSYVERRGSPDIKELLRAIKSTWKARESDFIKTQQTY